MTASNSLVLQFPKSLEFSYIFACHITELRDRVDVIFTPTSSSSSSSSILLKRCPVAAGNAYREAARVFKKLTWNHEAATTLVDAGNLMRDSDSLGAVECYREASGLFMELGRFMVAAKHLQTIAEIYEARGGQGDTEKVCKYIRMFYVLVCG